MAKKKTTRKDLLKGPDEFLSFSARTANFVREKAKLFTYAGYGAVALVLIYLGINTYMDRVNKKGQEAYNAAYYASIQTNEKGQQEDLEAAEALFQKVMDEYGGSKAGRLAPPQVAYLKYREKKYDDAISLYKEYLKRAPDKTPYLSLTQLALAACYEEMKDFEKAIETLNQIRSGGDAFLKEQAMLSLERVYRLSNQPEKAKGILQEFVETYKNSPFLAMAKARLDAFNS